MCKIRKYMSHTEGWTKRFMEEIKENRLKFYNIQPLLKRNDQAVTVYCVVNVSRMWINSIQRPKRKLWGKQNKLMTKQTRPLLFSTY